MRLSARLPLVLMQWTHTWSHLEALTPGVDSPGRILLENNVLAGHVLDLDAQIFGSFSSSPDCQPLFSHQNSVIPKH